LVSIPGIDRTPLSFSQTIRRLVTITNDAHAFGPENGGYIALEKALLACRPLRGYAADPPAVKVTIGQTGSA
jgi:hypothetical protein